MAFLISPPRPPESSYPPAETLPITALVYQGLLPWCSHPALYSLRCLSDRTSELLLDAPSICSCLSLLCSSRTGYCHKDSACMRRCIISTDGHSSHSRTPVGGPCKRYFQRQNAKHNTWSDFLIYTMGGNLYLGFEKTTENFSINRE